MLIFLRASTDLHPEPECEELILDWYSSCLSEFDENPRKSSDLGLIKVTPAIESLLEAGVKHSNFLLTAEDKKAIRNYCTSRSMERIKNLYQECR